MFFFNLIKNNYFIFSKNERLQIDQYYYIYSNCFFMRNNFFKGNGGIIYCKNKISNMNLKNCIFYSCSCNEWGGAIYFDSNKEGSNVILNKICINNCFANYYYHFSYINTFLNSNNSYNLITMNKCFNI